MRYPVWALSGNQGNQWLRARVQPLNITSSTFHVLFLATKGSSFRGDIAIDDISLKDCERKRRARCLCHLSVSRCFVEEEKMYKFIAEMFCSCCFMFLCRF